MIMVAVILAKGLNRRYIMSLVSQELGRISETLGRGISGLGTSRLAGEQQKTRSALIDYQLGRNRSQDAMAAERYGLEKPGLELTGLQSEAALKRLEQPATWASESSDAFTAMFMIVLISAVASVEISIFPALYCFFVFSIKNVFKQI